MNFDLVSYIAGIIATIIGSIMVALVIQWIQTRAARKRTNNALFSEIRQNYEIVKELLGEPSHWSYLKMPFNEACYNNAQQSGFLYDLKTEVYQKISKAYDIIRLIHKEQYGPTGSARITFEDLREILRELVEKDF